MKEKIAVVVLNWNRADDTLRCLQSLDAIDDPPFEVIVVDNGSTDGSQQRLEAARPHIGVLQTGANLGYGAGNNAGLAEARRRGADLVWILNNDTVVAPSALAAMVAVADAHPDAGLIGSAVRSSSAQSAAAFRWRGPLLVEVTCADVACEHDGHQVDSLDGSSMLIRTAMVETVGGFEERFFHYWEDTELCARARQNGWTVFLACRAHVDHDVGASLARDSSDARRYYVRNWLLFCRWRHGQGVLSVALCHPLLFAGRIIGARASGGHRVGLAVAGLRGAVDALRGRTGPLRSGGQLTT